MAVSVLSWIISIQYRIFATLRFFQSHFCVTICMFAAQFGLGALVGLLGPSLLHLAAQLEVSLFQAAMLFSARALGAALGSIGAVGGTVLVWGEATARRSVMQWGTVLCMGVAACNAVTPICTELLVLLVVVLVTGLFAGMLDSLSLMELCAAFQAQLGADKTPARHLSSMVKLLWARTASSFGAMTAALMLGCFVGEHGHHNARDVPAEVPWNLCGGRGGLTALPEALPSRRG